MASSVCVLYPTIVTVCHNILFAKGKWHLPSSHPSPGTIDGGVKTTTI